MQWIYYSYFEIILSQLITSIITHFLFSSKSILIDIYMDKQELFGDYEIRNM